MAERKNYHAYRKGNKDSETKRGHIHNDNVLSAYMVRSGYDYRHYMTLDATSTRKGWTTMRSPGAFQVKAGDDIPYNQNAVYFQAINGDIVLRANNGKILLDAENIQLIAKGGNGQNGTILLESNEDITLNSKNIRLNSDSVCKFFSSGSMQIVADASMDIYGGLVDCATGSSKIKKSKYPSSIAKLHNKGNFVV
jgi:hypothetical protein